MPQRILIVDDEPANVELLEAFLVDVADEVRGVTNSADAEDDFLTKPLDRQEVRLRVRNLLHTRHLFKELTRKTGSFPQQPG